MKGIKTLGKGAKFLSKRSARAAAKESMLAVAGVGSLVGRPIFNTARKGVRPLTAMPKTMDNTPLKVGLGLAAAGVGAASVIGPAAKDSLLDIGLGSPDADVAFTGRSLDARFLAGTAMGGFTGGLLAGTSKDAMSTGAYSMGGEAVGKASLGLGTLGTVVGAGLAIYGNKKLGSKAMFAGKRGMARRVVASAGAVMGGGAIGGALPFMGEASGAISARRQTEDEWFNESVFSESSKNSTAAISSITRATGDIVFGMHNTRGGM